MDSFLRLDKHLLAIFRWVILLFSVLAASTLLLMKFQVFVVDSYHDWAFYVTFPGILLIGFLQFFWRPQTYHKTVFYVVTYHVLALLSFMFVSGYATLLIFIWLMLILITDINFGRRAGLASATTFLASIFVWYPTSAATTGGTFAIIVVLAIFLVAVALLISEIRVIAEKRGQELGLAQAEERAERERLMALVNSMGDAVIATNEQGQIRIYNGAAASLLDTNADLIGRPITKVLHLQDSSGAHVNVRDLLRAQQTNIVRTDLLHALPNKERINLYLNIAIIHPDYQSGSEGGYTFLLRDITKEKSLEQERDEFISVISHELRTPIAIAEGSLSNALILKQKGVKQEVIDQSITEAHKQVLYLSKMANDLATLSRAERGGSDLEIEAVDAYGLFDQLRATFEQQAREKELTLVMRIKDKVDPIHTSKLYVQEILQNFITNAIKYSRQGVITVSAEMHTDKSVTFAVKDNGIGISKVDQKHLFEKFFRSEDYRTRESSGTGLGLYLVQKLAEQLKATVTVESRLNHGSTFALTIPAKTPPTT